MTGQTIEEYRASLRESLGSSFESLLADRVILPCNCDWPRCTGWAVIRRSWLDEARADRGRVPVDILPGVDLDAEPVPAVA